VNRRQFVFAVSGALALFAAARPARAECGGMSITEFVEALYQKQARLLAANTPIDAAEFNAVFSRSIRRLMRARHHAKDRPIGPTLNAFFGWGVLPGTEVKVGKVALASGDELGPAIIRVEIEHHGKSRELMVRVVGQNGLNGDWRIADISYDSGKNLADHYRGITRRN
jgi:hypothetical protein